MLEKFKWENDSYFTFEQEPGNETVEILEGTIHVVGDVADKTLVNFAYDDSVKAYNFESDIEDLIKLCKENGSTFNAEFEGDGEESRDFWRITVVNNLFNRDGSDVVYENELAQLRHDNRLTNQLRILAVSGHGRVLPRKDGIRNLSCPGLPTCPTCAHEHRILSSLLWGTP